ncbi:hypothetical protein HY251_16795 [bacterium]|nr:hypothetical protein [bacterium]
MSFKGSLSKSFVLVLALAGAARADVVTLTNGGKIEGEVVREDKDEVEVKLPSGSTVIPRSRVEKIEKKPSPEQEYNARRDKLAANDAQGRVDLARFVIDKHLPQVRVPILAIEAFRIDPSCKDAIDLLVKLDHHFETDAWLPPERWYPIHDFVRRESKWVTPEEVAKIEADAALERLRKAATDIESAIARLTDRVALLSDESALQATITNMKKELNALEAKETGANADLDARETDLRAATSSRIAATRDRQAIEAQAPRDPKQQADYNARVANARQAEQNAQLVERNATGNRDAAVAAVKAIAERKARASSRLDDARGMLENAKAEAEKAKAALAKAESDLQKGRDAIAAAEDGSARARDALVERKVKDEKAAMFRADALAKWQREHPASENK